jgi:hypothetical protein
MKKLTMAFVALGLFASAAFPLGASAQGTRTLIPGYDSWQPQWDHYHYDRRHVILGEVIRFRPYRVEIRTHEGNIRTIDLKGGTVIHPTGATPMRGDRIAVYGYWSNGTFIADGIVLR